MAWHGHAAGIVSVEHPVPADPAPEGYRRIARPAKDWRVLEPGAKRCHWTGGVGHKHCERPAVAEFNRKVRTSRSGLVSDRWWAYCETHTHGYRRWVVGDKVLEWQLIEGGESA